MGYTSKIELANLCISPRKIWVLYIGPPNLMPPQPRLEQGLNRISEKPIDRIYILSDYPPEHSRGNFVVFKHPHNLFYEVAHSCYTRELVRTILEIQTELIIEAPEWHPGLPPIIKDTRVAINPKKPLEELVTEVAKVS